MSSTRVEPLGGVRAASERRPRGAVAAGGLAGLAAGGAMAATLVVAALLADAPALLAFQAIGEVIPGIPAGGAGATVAGVLAHGVVSAGLGVVFAAIVPRDFPAPCLAGVGVGLALLAMGFAIAVFLPDRFVWALHAIGGSWVIAHGVYGTVLGLALR